METHHNPHHTNYSQQSSYRTYEEWKLEYNMIVNRSTLLVLTVPMRNGNTLKGRTQQTSPSLVLTVPMRNGNFAKAIPNVKTKMSSYRTYEEWKPPTSLVDVLELVSSYRTYEEWKLSKRQCNKLTCNSSYRTYEEWKPRYAIYTLPNYTCSYRTYEEWKLPSIKLYHV